MNAFLKICTLMLFTPLLSQAVQNRPSVSGLVIRAGTADPVSDAEVTLNVAPPPAALLAAANSSAARGISQPDLTATLIQLVLLRPQEFQIALNQLNTQGWPEMATLLKEWQAARDLPAGFPRRTITDGSGRFSVADVPSGQYWVIAKRDGFFGVSTGGRPPAEMVSVAVSIGTQPVSDVSISMVPGALISGRVRDSAGRAQPNVNVQVFTVSYQTNQPILQSVAAKTTDDRGEYRLFWLSPGEYFVAATPRQGAAPAPNPREVFVKSFHPNAADITKAIPVSVKIGDELSGIDIDIQAVPSLKVSGQVVSTLPAREPTGRGAQAGPVATPPTGRQPPLLQLHWYPVWSIAKIRTCSRPSLRTPWAILSLAVFVPTTTNFSRGTKSLQAHPQNANFVAKYETQGSSIRVAAGSKAAADVSIVTGGSAR